MNCLKCGKEFVSQRSTAKFCSTNCRVLFNSVKLVSVSDDELTIKNPVSVKSPQEEVKISVNKYEDMDDKLLWEEADRMATREYLARGWFGGRRSYKTKEIKYFPFKQIKDQFYKFLKNGQKELKIFNIEEISVPAEKEWNEVGKCENCFKVGQLTEMEVPTYDKDSGDMIQINKKICGRCQNTLAKVKSA